jgi:hypothetical protein
MRSSVRRLVARCAAVALAAGAALAGGPPAAEASAITLHVVHGASFENGKVPSRAVVAMFTSGGRVSNENYRSFDPWTQVAPDGLRVQASCSDAVPWLDLPILFIGGSGEGADGTNQINAYLPKNSDPEPWGKCKDSGVTEFRVLPGGDVTRMVSTTRPVVVQHPGAYWVNPGISGVPAVPVGKHLGANKTLTECAANPSLCPASTPNEPARLLMYTTGADFFVGKSFLAGRFNAVLNRVQRDQAGNVVGFGPDIWQYVTSVAREGYGKERIEVSLPDVTAGEYRIRMWNVQNGLADQDLRVFFGDPAAG